MFCSRGPWQSVAAQSYCEERRTRSGEGRIMSTTPSLQCNDCNTKLARGWFGLRKAKSSCTNCEKNLCAKCAGAQALIPHHNIIDADPPPLVKSSIQSYCKSCYEEVSILDYTKTYDIVEPTDDDDENQNITLIWVHGGGGSRAMFRPHARTLANQGYRSILIDLPGHGTLADTTLTLDSCTETVQQILEKECINCKKVIYIGGSLGAYIGFYILGQLKDGFAGAILIDCGQNVGPDCSLKARVGLWFLNKMSGHMSNKALMGALMGEVSKSKADFNLVECCFSAGMHFKQGPAQCMCLHSVAPADYIPTYDFPILFFNGSEDYRDSERKWLNLCNDKERSDLKVFEGGDHFFCHDTRFVDDMLQRMDTFIQATSSS